MAGGGIGGPLALVFSGFSKGEVIEIKDVSDKAGLTFGHKRVAILVNNKNKLKNGQADVSKICEGTSENKHELVGLGILKTVNAKQVVGSGFVEGALVTVGCVKGTNTGSSGSSSNRTLDIVGNPSNFWYGILDYENVIVELLSHGIDKTKTNSEDGQDQTVGWDGKGGVWKSEEVTGLEAFDKCYAQKLPEIGDKLKRAFDNGRIKPQNINVNNYHDCSNYKFGVSVITIYSKRGSWAFWPYHTDGMDWGKFNKFYGDRLSNIRIGQEKLMIGNKDVFKGFPRKINFLSNN